MSDRQQHKTQKKFTQALIMLCSEKNYFDITIADICEAADMHKSSFYRYYDNKDMLLREIEKNMIAELRGLSDEIFSFDYGNYPANIGLYTGELDELWYHAQTNKKIYKALLSPGGDSHFTFLFGKLLVGAYENMLTKNGLTFGKNQSYIIDFFKSGITAVIYKFVCDDIDFSELKESVYKLCIMLPMDNFVEK